MSTEILLVPHNHFDPTWRRCFDRVSVYNGVSLRSYAEIEERILRDWLRLAREGYTCTEGQTAVMRKFLERNPDVRQTLRNYAESGVLAVVLAGETVQDSNLPSAEGLVRNFLAAQPFYRELVGEEHPALKMAWLEDAFGNSPNYPQVLRGVGAEVACSLSYRPCPEAVWVGIDGTKIACMDHLPVAAFISSFEKHPPCPGCKGMGCDTCGGSGVQYLTPIAEEEIRRAIANIGVQDHHTVMVALFSEEILPTEGLAALIDEMNQQQTDYHIRFATSADMYAAYRDTLQQQVAAHDCTPTPDLNPAMPGCMVSRIRVKQRTRAIAYQLVAAEAGLATAAWQAASPTSPPADLLTAWQRVTFCQFHDAITGTHIDSAYRELMDMLDEAEAIAVNYLPPAPAVEEEFFTSCAGEVMQMAWGALTVTFDRTGIHRVLTHDQDVFGTLPYRHARHRRDYRIGELTLETDFGDAWGTRIYFSPEANTSVIQLGDYHQRVETAERAIRWHGVYSGGDHMVRDLRWTITVRPSRGGQRLEFTTEVDWDTHSRRLRVITPIATQAPVATYEVPFGFIDRIFDNAKIENGQWNQDSREFPTLHWARAAIDAQRGVAVLNRGLPCYRWMPGRFDVSLLRSPESQMCAVEPCSYEFWDIDGLRDSGHHRFEYALWPYTAGLSAGDLTRGGYTYNQPAPLIAPFDIHGDVVVTAWKLAEDGQGWILRLQEAGGAETTVDIALASAHQVTVTDLLERPVEPPVTTDHFTTVLTKHKILTLRISQITET